MGRARCLPPSFEKPQERAPRMRDLPALSGRVRAIWIRMFHHRPHHRGTDRHARRPLAPPWRFFGRRTTALRLRLKFLSRDRRREKSAFAICFQRQFSQHHVRFQNRLSTLCTSSRQRSLFFFFFFVFYGDDHPSWCTKRTTATACSISTATWVNTR